MNKLYSIAFKRLLSNLTDPNLTPSTILNTLSANNIQPTPNYLLHRLPKEDLKDFLKHPCPIAKYSLPYLVLRVRTILPSDRDPNL
jgi:hypothetical protein